MNAVRGVVLSAVTASTLTHLARTADYAFFEPEERSYANAYGYNTFVARRSAVHSHP